MSARWLLRLYPRAWRERYGDELLALLDTTALDSRIVRDVVGGAIGEWIHRGGGAAPQMIATLRALLGYYCATQMIWWGMASVELLEFQPSSYRAWTPEGLLLSAVIQARAAGRSRRCGAGPTNRNPCFRSCPDPGLDTPNGSQ